MFARTILCAFLAFFLAGLATASPLPMPLQFGRRGGLGPVDTIEVYRRESLAVRDNGIEFLPRQIPTENAVKSPDGTIVPYGKRQIPTEQAVKAPDGTIEPYRRTIPEEVAVKADSPGNIVEYREVPTLARRANIPVESPVKALTPGDIVPY
ncbi:hypothetical protein EV361DRAFT_1030999 [Lentinula raphanica]|uniref:Uncharacterized protein n=1 Tax=Lentinula raphanica TaxID=153919 RepID=A0AA38UHG4_9AGAR|nr:hypothetical protein C8R42DRAFT_722687 [Lentinula raphanica]KAJ3758635.1 hypothetical protein EV360DRAFT_70145 [Lentinula raphanica]KAJ3841365.1 hypothetical protein F5878DRAFT_723029 [Lentinula raphanica]KAJ3975459.1 hypothetical protein EV361DRAFT_1030999 [Lentinula raphanica]